MSASRRKRINANQKIVLLSEARDLVMDAFDDAVEGMSETLQYDLLADLIETLGVQRDCIEYKREARRARGTRRAA